MDKVAIRKAVENAIAEWFGQRVVLTDKNSQVVASTLTTRPVAYIVFVYEASLLAVFGVVFKSSTADYEVKFTNDFE
jgi:hypothetical protein